MKTKDRIVETAVRLFNEQGSGPVSTNHIAEAAGISPGNLYYHFRNKEEIIRAIFERLFHTWDVELALPADQMPTLETMRALVRLNFEIMWNYRFVYRELLALLRQDAALYDRFVAVRRRGFDGFRMLIGALVYAGVLIAPEDEDTVERLAELVWLISEFWPATTEISGKGSGKEQMERGVELMMQVLKPYFAAP